MSGGSLNYFYCELKGHTRDFGDKELNNLIEDLVELFQDREWYLSGDSGKGDWREARDSFKEKWFTRHGREERIEQYLAEIGNEVKDMFGMDNRRCKNCTHWTKKDDSRYGTCEFEKHCMMHRSESCEKFELKGEGI